MSGALAKVIEEVKSLTPEERRELRKALDAMPADENERAKQDELARRLLAKGIITRIPPPITDFTRYRNRKPIEFTGKPVSETIIEERR